MTLTSIKVRCRGGRCGSPAESRMHSIAHKRCQTKHETCCCFNPDELASTCLLQSTGTRNGLQVTTAFAQKVHIMALFLPSTQSASMRCTSRCYARQGCMPAGLHAPTCTASNGRADDRKPFQACYHEHVTRISWEGSTSKSTFLMVAVAVHPRTATSET